MILQQPVSKQKHSLTGSVWQKEANRSFRYIIETLKLKCEPTYCCLVSDAELASIDFKQENFGLRIPNPNIAIHEIKKGISLSTGQG